MRILLVDDDPEIRLVVQFALSRLGGHSVTAVPDQNEAVAQAGQGRFDLVLLDLVLAETDGVTVAHQLRTVEGYATTPIILLTGRDQTASATAAERAGAIGVIPKPFDPQTLPQQVAALVGNTTDPT